MTDTEYMRLALEEAAKGKGFTSPNPCVGAVVVKDGKILGRGYHPKAGGPHAEVVAIDNATANAPTMVKGATIYATLEPCNHYGKTPPCTKKILDAGIARVVVACNDPNPNVEGGGNAFLRKNGVEVISGILEDQAATLIEDFIWAIQHPKDPFVTLKCAATLDGHIATRTGDSKWITNDASRTFGHRLRHEADAILVGSGTLHADDPSLTARIQGQPTVDPARVILDSRLTIRPDAKVINKNSDAPVIVVTGPEVPGDKRKKLENAGVTVIQTDLTDNGLDLRQVMIKLGAMSISSLLIEGGGQVAASALKAGIVNKVCYFIAPKFLGANDGIPVFNGTGPEKIRDAFELSRVTTRQFGADILVTGYLDRDGLLRT
ncbi:MAG: bifunctional diaminohydroxyphosphoribosylaminopyrimidine deaminase/5-amino-6-(5-phosphoribosylamino)uracil reductase RibD [Desulfobacterales bacterium]|nr:bifunctional diaminohydroxyphosphoribosylaminopyrimidine deaminase/5-amino-6-(5-phosphoribosylamino)uracil reductase RibD [Desulfobacterales bacterium]